MHVYVCVCVCSYLNISLTHILHACMCIQIMQPSGVSLNFEKLIFSLSKLQVIKQNIQFIPKIRVNKIALTGSSW